MQRYTSLLLLAALLVGCTGNTSQEAPDHEYSTDVLAPFSWDNALVYFLLTDRFYNADSTNDQSVGRRANGAPLRDYHGGDIRGIIKKLDEGYFQKLGINVIWTTPPYENIHGFTDEGTGRSYGFHGYWPRDWTRIDPNLGTMADYREMVQKAHAQGIRVLLDVIVNHTGPVTVVDTQWPADWVRTEPQCTYQDFESTVSCTLVKNLPDIRTDASNPVELPEFLVMKWKSEGRYDQEVKELDEFFETTGYPRLPKYYIIKWLVDYVRELGIDGFRVDTAKHTEPGVWGDLYREAAEALVAWRLDHPESVASKWEDDFYMVGEVYNYAIDHGLFFPYSDQDSVNFYAEGFHAMINFAMKSDAQGSYEEVFADYSQMLHNGELAGFSTMNYLASHDDGGPYDKFREQPYRAANMLLLTPGAAQIYYGDEISRVLDASDLGAQGDAHLRTPMDWKGLEENDTVAGHMVQDVLAYYQKLGTFRNAHPAVGAGVHQQIQAEPYVFSRLLMDGETVTDGVVVAMADSLGTVPVGGVFADGTEVMDYYTGARVKVAEGHVTLPEYGPIVLLGERRKKY